jgi:hypothetical protein
MSSAEAEIGALCGLSSGYELLRNLIVRRNSWKQHKENGRIRFRQQECYTKLLIWIIGLI